MIDLVDPAGDERKKNEREQITVLPQRSILRKDRGRLS
jgi:hypothetical protein